MELKHFFNSKEIPLNPKFDILSLRCLLILIFLLNCSSLMAQDYLMVKVMKDESGDLVEGANIVAWDEDHHLIFDGKTNNVGIFEVDANLKTGQYIILTVFKPGFLPDEQKYLFQTGKNEIHIRLKTDFNDPSISGYVYDRRAIRKGKFKGIPEIEVEVQLVNSGERLELGQTDENGYFFSFLEFPEEENLAFFFNDTSNYYSSYRHLQTYQKDQRTLGQEIRLRKNKKIKPKHWLMGGGFIVGLSGYLMNAESNTLEDRYRNIADIDFNYNTEEERNNDFEKAELLRSIGMPSLIVGSTALLTGILYDYLFKNDPFSGNRSGSWLDGTKAYYNPKDRSFNFGIRKNLK